MTTLANQIEGLLVHHSGTYTLRPSDNFSTIPGLFIDSNDHTTIKQALRDGGLYAVTVEYPIGKRTVFAAHASNLNEVPWYPSHQSK